MLITKTKCILYSSNEVWPSFLAVALISFVYFFSIIQLSCCLIATLTNYDNFGNVLGFFFSFLFSICSLLELLVTFLLFVTDVFLHIHFRLYCLIIIFLTWIHAYLFNRNHFKLLLFSLLETSAQLLKKIRLGNHYYSWWMRCTKNSHILATICCTFLKSGKILNL